MNRQKKLPKKKPLMILASDTENTVPPRHEDVKGFVTRVWACGYAEIGATEYEDCHVFNDLGDMFDSWISNYEKYNITVYFHNLSYDGTLICDYLLRNGFQWVAVDKRAQVQEYGFTTLISDMGQWYSVRFNWKGHEITLKDSLKILPFKVAQIAKSLHTKRQKLVGEIDYTIDRPEGWEITPSEMKYIKNDILVMSEALQMIKPYGLLNHFTIGGCALESLKKSIGIKVFKEIFPQLPAEVDSFIRDSYRGGWCYVKDEIANKVMSGIVGRVFDVNSLYPWALHSHYEDETPRPYPYYEPTYFEGEEEFKKICDRGFGYFVRISVDMKVKEDHLPFIQIKHNRFKDNEYVKDTDGEVTITLARPDFELMLEQYDLRYLKIIEGYYFYTKEGIFDNYIDHWYKQKEKATIEGNKVLRQVSKLMLNNSYGKFGESTDGTTKIPYMDKDKDCVRFEYSPSTKKSLYVAVASYCTAYARGKTVRAAQANYDMFCYSDTDSIHLVGNAPVKGIKIDPVKLGYWDNETNFSKCRFVRQKTYIEYTTQEENKDVTPYLNIKACGAPEEVKTRLLYKVNLDEDLTIDEQDNILNEKRTPDEVIGRFTYGLVETGKLSRRTTSGGVVLFNTTFNLRKG